MIPHGGITKLQYEKTLNALHLALEQLWLALKGTSSALALTRELVVIVRATTSNLTGAGNLKPLRCCLVCPDFWHLLVSLLVLDSES